MNELEPFTSEEMLLKLSLKNAINLKNDYSYLLNDKPFIGKDGTRYNWFRLVVAPSKYEVRTEFISAYYNEYPYVDDEHLASLFGEDEYTVLTLMHRHYDDGLLLHGTLLSILNERGITVDINKYLTN